WLVCSIWRLWNLTTMGEGSPSKSLSDSASLPGALTETWRGRKQQRRRLRQHRQHRQHVSCLVSDPSNDGLALGAIAAWDADDADGADGIFGACAHPDHSGAHPAFTPEGDLDAQGAQERLRPS